MKNLTEFAIILNKKDTVATALRELDCGDYAHDGNQITITQNIPIGFKVALKNITKGDKVFKYGYPIGIATANINCGEMIHTHNLISAINTSGRPSGT